MYIDYKLEGKYVNLRSVTEEDAEFILDIRNNPQISKYLPPLNVTVEQQRQWITKQRADKDSYYFILETPDCTPIGTLSIYDIVDDHGEGGRSCSIGEPFANVEASLLFNDFVFDVLKLDYISIWTYEANRPVLALNKSIGYVWVKNDFDKNGNPFRVSMLERDNYKKRKDVLLKKLRIII